MHALVERVSALRSEPSELSSLIVYGLKVEAGIHPKRALLALRLRLASARWLSVARVGRLRERIPPPGARGAAAASADAPGERPMLLTFASADHKHTLFRHSRQFREAGGNLANDLFPAQRAVRTQL